MRLLLTLVAVIALLHAAAARAEADKVRIVQPYGVLYLPSYVVADRHLIEREAEAAGLGPVTVTLTRVASGPVGSDMVLAGDADIAMGGFGPALTLWDKTRGSQKVRGFMPLCSSPVMLVSTDPRIRSIRDLTDRDRIAVSAIKVTDQAITLQMAAAREWGWDQRFRLDPLTVAMSNPDGMAALLGGLSEVKNHATIIPFAVAELESGKAHLVMTSDEVLEPGASTVVAYAPARFHDGSPRLYAATARAFEDAIAWINAHPREAAEIYVAREPQKNGVDWIERMIRDPKLVRYDSTPRGLKAHADFMHELGTLKNKAESWKDLFWDNNWVKDGN
ncbi:MAG: ABC transporter substrate-binding protein [Proteobacteria bacterium]|nr:ABC transporter substrate-binding protein [Pseudomonadota bacterium]